MVFLVNEPIEQTEDFTAIPPQQIPDSIELAELSEEEAIALAKAIRTEEISNTESTTKLASSIWIREGNALKMDPSLKWCLDDELLNKVLSELETMYWEEVQWREDYTGVSKLGGPESIANAAIYLADDGLLDSERLRSWVTNELWIMSRIA